MPEDDDLDASQGQVIVESRQSWDKLPDESQKAFEAFVRYRDAEKRSFKNVADQLNCSPQNIFQWSSRFAWRLRCDAFDMEQDRVQREELARSRVRMRERHIRLAVAMQGIAACAVREWQAKIEQGLPLNLSPEQIALLTKCGVDLERATMGRPGEAQRTAINIFVGTHRYENEGALIPGEQPKLLEDFEREQYETLSPSGKAALECWRDPPKKRLN
jgi:hypothetical protein